MITRRIGYILSMLLVTICLMASRAPQRPHVITLEDGSVVTCYIQGNAGDYYLMSADGRYIVQDGQTYRLGTPQEWQALQDAIARQDSAGRNGDDRAMTNGLVSRAAATVQPGEIPQNDKYGHKFLPHKGKVKIAVLLAEFNDRAMTFGKEDFDKVLNGEGYADMATFAESAENYGSVAQYFKDCSNGKFSPQFDVFGVYHVDADVATYINGSTSQTVLAAKVASLAEADLDFWQYDLVCVMVAGYSYQYSAQKNDVTVMHIAGMTSTPLFTADGKGFYRVLLAAELFGDSYDDEKYGGKQIMGVGVFCHEMCHAMGLPDVYPTSTWTTSGYYSTRYNDRSMEYWDLMDSGEHINSGRTPLPLGAMERWMLGWADAPEVVTESDYTLKTWMGNESDLNAVTALRVQNPNESNEFWVLENIPQYEEGMEPKMGWYMPDLEDGGMGHGMMVTHINYKPAFVLSNGHINNDTNPDWTLMPADGHLYSSYLSFNSGAKGKPSYDYLYMSYSDILKDTETDLFPISGGTPYYNKEVVNYEDPTAEKVVRRNGEYGGEEYLNGYLKTELEAVNSITNWGAYTATTGLLDMTKIAQNGGNGAPVTFTYGNPTAVKGVTDNAIRRKRTGIYDLCGRYKGMTLQGLERGVYIKDGEKIIKQ